MNCKDCSALRWHPNKGFYCTVPNCNPETSKNDMRDLYLMANEMMEKQASNDVIMLLKANLQYYLDTTEKNGIVCIPKYIVENFLEVLPKKKKVFAPFT